MVSSKGSKRHSDGPRIKIDAHFRPASQAYYEATPQKLLSQSRFIHPELHRLVVDQFNAEVYATSGASRD